MIKEVHSNLKTCQRAFKLCHLAQWYLSNNCVFTEGTASHKMEHLLPFAGKSRCSIWHHTFALSDPTQQSTDTLCILQLIHIVSCFIPFNHMKYLKKIRAYNSFRKNSCTGFTHYNITSPVVPDKLFFNPEKNKNLVIMSRWCDFIYWNPKVSHFNLFIWLIYLIGVYHHAQEYFTCKTQTATGTTVGGSRAVFRMTFTLTAEENASEIWTLTPRIS